MAESTSTKLTYEDFCLFPDDGRRHEIIDGKHYLQATPNTKHQRVSGNIVYAIATYLQHRKLGEVFFARFDVVLSKFDVVEPDIMFIRESRKHILTEDNIKGAPDLLVEILSSSTREYDEVVKFKCYELLGVAEYWIVDAEQETVSIYRRTSSGFALEPVADDITTPLIPGFSLPIQAIFELP